MVVSNIEDRISTLCDVDFDNLVDLLCWRASAQTDQILYRFLADGEVEDRQITYGQLDCAARAIAASLQVPIPVGERALLLYAPGIDFVAAFFGCLYAGVIAVPVYPPNPSRPDRGLEKLTAIALNSGARLALTTSPIMAVKDYLFANSPKLQSLEWLATDLVAEEFAEKWSRPEVSGETLALLQYTSGSTAAPKGVIVSQANLLDNQRMIQTAFKSNRRCIGVSWLPMYHDMGLIGTTLQPLYAGYPCVFMSPVDFVQCPFRWLSAISNYRGTTSGGPSFAYDLCVRKVTAEQMEQLDLSCWDLAFNGGEPVRSETMDAFAEKFAACGFRKEAFYPCYGLAEGTLFVTGGLKRQAPRCLDVSARMLMNHRAVQALPESSDVRTLVSCGTTWLGQRVLIVDPETVCGCPPGKIGEIWLAGPSVAHGYWGQAEVTQETFQAFTSDTGDGPFLRTGDLGFLKDGELFVTGRRKDLLIIHEKHYYPQDIELLVEKCHSAIRFGCSAVFSVPVHDEERLVVVAEVERSYQRGYDPDFRQGSTSNQDVRRVWESASSADEEKSPYLQEIVSTIRRAVATEHGLPLHAVVLLKPATIPKTSSGRIQRHLCRSGYQTRSLAGLHWDEPNKT